VSAGLQRKLFELNAAARAPLLLKESHRLVVIREHPLHILLVKGLAMQGRKPLPHLLVLWVECRWRLDPETPGNGSQFLICCCVIPDHAVGEALHLRVLRWEERLNAFECLFERNQVRGGARPGAGRPVFCVALKD
jgi:hypothetical protein